MPFDKEEIVYIWLYHISSAAAEEIFETRLKPIQFIFLSISLTAFHT